MLTTLGTHSPFGSFLREDVREIGHWLRLGCLEDNLEQGTAGAQGRRRGAGAGRQATGAFANTAAECAAGYCEGDGREGRRTAQLRVRKRWIKAVNRPSTNMLGRGQNYRPVADRTIFYGLRIRRRFWTASELTQTVLRLPSLHAFGHWGRVRARAWRWGFVPHSSRAHAFSARVHCGVCVRASSLYTQTVHTLCAVE